MYKPDHEAGKLKRPTKQTLTRTDSYDRNLFYGDSKLHKVMVQQSADAFTKVADSALRLEDSVSDEAKVHVGIIGCGRIGQCHAANLANKVPDAELVCVSDFFEESARLLAKQYNVPMACTDYKDLINNADVHAIIVCSPTDTHADIIKEASAAGKHIFCEKPIDKSLTVIDEALAAVEEAGVKLMIGFQKRYDADFGRAYDARAKGFLGTPVKLHLTSRDPAPPPVGYLKNSGGVFLDQTIHGTLANQPVTWCDWRCVSSSLLRTQAGMHALRSALGRHSCFFLTSSFLRAPFVVAVVIVLHGRLVHNHRL